MIEPTIEPTVESKVVFKGVELTLRVNKVRLPDGRLATQEIAERPASACIVPVDGRGNVLLVRQYRRAAEQVLLEVPAGKLDQGELPEQGALRELREETGFTAANLRHLASFWIAPGWCTQFTHAYLATDLTPSRLAADDDENITVEQVPLARIPAMIAAGEIRDAKSITALLLALRALEKGH